MADIHHFESFSVIVSGVTVELDMSRLQNNCNRAQYELDTAVMTSMVPYMPMQTGTFINTTKAQSAAIAGTGVVVAAAPPYGRFLYEGMGMVGEKSRSAWAKKGEKKVTNGKPLSFSRGQSHWFDAAKAAHLNEWVDIVKKEVGAG